MVDDIEVARHFRRRDPLTGLTLNSRTAGGPVLRSLLWLTMRGTQMCAACGRAGPGRDTRVAVGGHARSEVLHRKAVRTGLSLGPLREANQSLREAVYSVTF